MNRKISLVIAAVLLLGLSFNASALIQVDMYSLIDAQPGEKTENKIVVTNPDSEPAEVNIWKEDWKTTSQNGQVVKQALGKTGAVSQSLAPFLTIESPSKLTIPPNSSKAIRFTTNLPADKQGSYWTAIVVSQKPSEEESAEEGEVKVNTRFSFYSKVIRFNSQNDNLKPWVEGLSDPKEVNLKDSQKGLEFEAKLQNKGEVAFFFPSLFIVYEGLVSGDEFKNPDKEEHPIAKVDGKEAVTRIAPAYFLPGEELNVKVTLPFTLPPGKYTAKMKILMERGEYAPIGGKQFKVEGG